MDWTAYAFMRDTIARTCTLGWLHVDLRNTRHVNHGDPVAVKLLYMEDVRNLNTNLYIYDGAAMPRSCSCLN